MSPRRILSAREQVEMLAPWRQAALSDEDWVSVAEQTMERAGHGTDGFHIPTATLQQARDRGMFDEYGQADARTLQRQHSAEAEDWVNGILKQHGWPPNHPDHHIRVEPEHWDLRGGGQAVTDGWNYIGLSGNHASKLALLHEMAHVLTGTTHGMHEGHGPNFQAAAHQLYHDHLGPEAAEVFRSILPDDRHLARIAMPAPLPQGITFQYHDGIENEKLHRAFDGSEHSRKRILPTGPTVTAHLPGSPVSVGNIQWFAEDHPQVQQGVADHGEVQYIWVDEALRRSNIGTALFDQAQKIEPAVHHSTSQTEFGKQWSRYEQSRHKQAMPTPLPDNVTFHYHTNYSDVPKLHNGRPAIPEYARDDDYVDDPEWVANPRDWVHRGEPGYRENALPGFEVPAVEARVDGKHAGYLSWHPRRKYVTQIQVFNPYTRQSIATSMWDHAKQIEPELRHSDNRTPLGKEWVKYEQSRHQAALNQDLVNRLGDEFHQWWGEGGQKTPRSKIPDPERGPLGHWPNIENFLGDKYPAAYRGHDMGQEEAGWFLDGHEALPYMERNLDITPYETGPEALAYHGYDPKETAAAMLLLHNQSHPLRGDMLQQDVDRLHGIVQKRQQMQKEYDRRLTTAAANWRHSLDDGLDPDELLTLYHRTTRPNANQIVRSQSWIPNEERGDYDAPLGSHQTDQHIYFALRPGGDKSYGPSVVSTQVPRGVIKRDETQFWGGPGSKNDPQWVRVHIDDLAGRPIVRERSR